MKPNIHPNYNKVAFKDSTTDEVFIISSTMTSNTTLTIDGTDYPLVIMDVTSSSHPFYTGKQKHAQAEGRVARFNKRYNLD